MEDGADTSGFADFNSRPRVEGVSAVLRSARYTRQRAFQFSPSRGGRPKTNREIELGDRFQFSPSRGGRPKFLIKVLDENRISILALAWRASLHAQQQELLLHAISILALAWRASERADKKQ